jgi:hypothetical protein
MLLRSVFTTFLMLFLTGFLLFSGCRKFEGDQTIPAYLHIDSIGVNADYFIYGSSTHNITDSWVYVNDQLIGAFELPATIPVLASGINKLEIRPGIKLNGISATRVPYPFYKPYINEEFRFVEDSTTHINPVLTYYDNTVMPLNDDFDRASISLEKTGKSDTTIFKTTQNALYSEYSAHSGLVHLLDEIKTFELATADLYQLPGQGRPVFLEIDYKCDNPFGVGLFVDEFSTIIVSPLIVVNSSEKWNKIYINLGPTISLYGNGARFKVFIEGRLNEGDTEARFYFDNIKIVHR